jgi:hypothetical protein
MVEHQILGKEAKKLETIEEKVLLYSFFLIYLQTISPT